MAKFKDFDFAALKEKSDKVADRLRVAGIRFSQRITKETGRRPVYVIAVHPADLGRAGELMLAAVRRDKEGFVRKLSFVRQPYADKDMLIARAPNEAGYYVSGIYDGKPYDETKFRLVPGGWDHEHCYICSAKVLAGAEWWVTHPVNFEDEMGLCLECHDRLFVRGLPGRKA
jgi:hypothetical protein